LRYDGDEAIEAEIMRNRGSLVLGVIMLLAVATVSRADLAGYPDFALGIGYAHIEVGGSSSQLHSMDALRFDPDLSFSPFDRLPELRVGAAFGVSMVLDNSSRTIISNGGTLIITGSSDVPFLLLEPEARLSWRQVFPDGFYIEPGVGVGGAFGQLKLSSDTESIDKWQSTFDARVFLNVGIAVPGGIAGLQASYMHGGTMDFGQNARGDLNQFYIGIYGAIQF
jgi:hypothetical protein